MQSRLHQEQSFSIDGDHLFGHKLSPIEPFLALLGYFQKIGNIKVQGFFVTCFLCLPSPSSHELRTDFRPPFTYSHTLFQSTPNCYRAIMPTNQTLPSFNFALHLNPDRYKTVLPNLSYPSRPSTHVPWYGSSAPLVFSVSQSYFFFVFCLSLTFFCPQKTTRPEITVANPNVQVSYTYSSILTLTLTLYQFQIPNPNTVPFYCTVADAFYGVGMLIWVRVISILCTFIFWFPVFL